MAPSQSQVKSRILILSDTHGKLPFEDDGPDGTPQTPTSAYRNPLPEADVAIHCGDLTMRSAISEFEDTFSMLRALRAPLKLVIAGNHDLALDRAFWNQLVAQNARYHDPSERGTILRRPDVVRAILDAAEEDGVRFLEEGTHVFDLENGARLKVYASPMTPEYGGWAFQYPQGHGRFDIPEGMDVAVTHGPPRDVLDTTTRGERAGCENLFDSLYRARPRISCFGHIHEAWGAQLAAWKDVGSRGRAPYAVVDVIDAEKSRIVERLDLLQGTASDTTQQLQEKEARRNKLYRERSILADVTSGGRMPLKPGEHTLFVNAAIMDVRYRPTNVPWLVDIELPRSSST